MVVQHNIPAINSHRQLGINNNATAKNLEKLSSGFRINRAGDDAAGLAISEKMRGQIRGLAMAEQNVSNGISLIQTAEGGLNETHAILQRMRELAVQSANGTYDDDVDRYNLNKEVDALKSEIDRIASSTHYNGIKLLDGTMGANKIDESLTGDATEALSDVSLYTAVGMNANAVRMTYDATNTSEVAAFTATAKGQEGIISITADNNGSITAVALQVGDKTYMADIATDGTITFLDDDGKSLATLAGFNVAGTGVDGTVIRFKFGENGEAGNAQFIADGTVVAGPKDKLIFQIGANGTLDQRVGLHVDNMSSGYLGEVGQVGEDILKISEISIALQDDANRAIKVIDAAINQVSSTRSDLGALQNRLEHTLNNLGVTKENLTAAESTIRDVDMAKEMMEFTKNSILVQASQAMLAQATQLPQGVLSLLR